MVWPLRSTPFDVIGTWQPFCTRVDIKKTQGKHPKHYKYWYREGGPSCSQALALNGLVKVHRGALQLHVEKWLVKSNLWWVDSARRRCFVFSFRWSKQTTMGATYRYEMTNIVLVAEPKEDNLAAYGSLWQDRKYQQSTRQRELLCCCCFLLPSSPKIPSSPIPYPTHLIPTQIPKILDIMTRPDARCDNACLLSLEIKWNWNRGHEKCPLFE
jgi:hypothetical protein